jgi:hypothetical protein
MSILESSMHRAFLAKFVLCSLAFALLFAATPTEVPAQVNITVSFGPPPIPYYIQPPDPTQDYIWSPGYWAYDSYGGGYYWVPGTWVPAPAYGMLWTPGYWAWDGSNYFWTPGYWARSVGYYGGVNYGYGYYGHGYVGGRWHGRRFEYNTAVTRVNPHVRDVYVNRTVVVHNWNRVAYNGGRGGVIARPNTHELAERRDHRVNATQIQVRHQQFAEKSRTAFVRVNRGRPPVTAVAHPLTAIASERRSFQPEHRAIPERAQPYHAQATHGAPALHVAPAHAAFHAPPPHSAFHPAPPMHAAPHAYAAPPVHHAYAAPPAHHPVPHAYAAPPMRAAPQMRAAPHPPSAHAAPQPPTARGGGGGGRGGDGGGGGGGGHDHHH